MPFTKTEVDIHDDYVVETVDAAWLTQGVKSPKHLMLGWESSSDCRCEDPVRPRQRITNRTIRPSHGCGRASRASLG